MAKQNDQTPEPEQVTESNVLVKLTEALTRMAERQAVAPDSGTAVLLEKLTVAMERISEAQVEGSKIIASETRRAHRPSNEVVPMTSVFNRRGTMLGDYQKPHLKCLMMIPWLAEWESLTREEVELLNLLQSGEYILRRIDNSKLKVKVAVEYGVDEVTPSRLLLNHETGFNNDNARLMPPLTDILRQILKQHEPAIKKAAAVVLSDEEEEALIAAGELTVSV